nr:hypothetical protein [Kutzneria buriramensis]WKX14227.1 hypothetical protein Q4V64_44610 [Kutzneria buriramensis]
MLQDVRRSVGDPLADRQQRGRSRQHGAGGQSKHADKIVTHSARIAGVGHLGKPLK